MIQDVEDLSKKLSEALESSEVIEHEVSPLEMLMDMGDLEMIVNNIPYLFSRVFQYYQVS